MALYGIQFTITYVAWDNAASAGKTGDAGNHTLKWIKDGTAGTPANSPSEVDSTNCPGLYKLVLTAAEAQALFGTLAGKSSTGDVSIIPASVAFEKLPNAVAGEANGVFIAGTNAATTITTALTTTFTGNLTGSVGSVTALAAGAIQSIWDALSAALTTTGSIGKRLVDCLTGDAFAVVNNGTYGNSALNTDLDTLLSRLSALRAGYLDNLSGGAVATAAQVSGLAVNTRANLNVPVEIETPDSSTQVFKIRLHLFDVEGNMEAPDGTPTIALTNAAGTDRSSRISNAANPSTGVYTWDYTATAGDTEEQLVWVFTVVEGSLTRTYPATSYVVEESAYRFSSTDRANLNAILADTDSLDTTKLTTARAAVLSDLIDGGRLDLLIDAIKTVLDTQGGTGTGLSAMPWNAAWDAEVQSEATDALNAYDPPTNAEMEARTLVAASYGTAANQTTILARIGDFAGSGLNTVLGFFRALLRKTAALTPSDVGGTFDNTTDSLEAQRDASIAALPELTADAGATPTPQQALTLLYMKERNNSQATSTSRVIKNSAGTTIASATSSDVAGTFSQGKLS